VAISVGTGCFSAETLVTLINQKQIPIGQLRSGDQLLTIDGTTIVNTEMMMMLDQNQLSSGYIPFLIILQFILSLSLSLSSHVSYNCYCIWT
jgi:hypothetical protein